MRVVSLLASNLRITSGGPRPRVIVRRTGPSLLALVCVEASDLKRDSESVANRIATLLRHKGDARHVQPVHVILHPFVHLSESASSSRAHVRARIRDLATQLTSSRLSVQVLPTSQEISLCGRLTDAIATSRYSMSRSALDSEIAALLRVFSRRTILRALSAATEAEHAEGQPKSSRRRRVRHRS